MSEFKTIAKVGSVPDGSSEAFPLDGKMIAVFRTGEEYHAIDDFCPHMGASLAGGHFEDGEVSCPWHAWRFRVCDGTWCDNPKIKIPAYEVRIQGDEIQVRPQYEVPPKTPDSEPDKPSNESAE